MENIFVAGHRGMVGSAIVRALSGEGLYNIITAERNELDLSNQASVTAFFAKQEIDQVYLAGAKVGGIFANNTYPADFIYQNLMIEANVIHAAHLNGIQKLLFLGSSCIYPKFAPQPITEEALLSGALEATNEPYAIAKIAGIKLCESYNRQYGRDYRSVMPTNLYGPNDNFHAENSHVIPALMRRFHLAKLSQNGDYEALAKFEHQNGRLLDAELPDLGLSRAHSGELMRHPSLEKKIKVVIWGSGTPKREFLHVDEMASACVHIMKLDRSTLSQHISPMLSHVNLGSGIDLEISELAKIMASVVGFDGIVEFDSTKPDGVPKKLLDVTRLESLGWKSKIDLLQGLELTYHWFSKYDR